MKKLISILALFLVLGCAQDEKFIVIDENQEVPEALFIEGLVGIKLSSSIVSDRIAMNIKLPSDGAYRVKIRHSMTNELISQEKLIGKEGDNILKVYVNTLENSSYKLELTKENHIVVGVTLFSKF
jgi:hypothetical protein